MPKKTLHHLIPPIADDLYTLILPHLSFRNLTQFAESENQSFDAKVKKQAELILKKTYPGYFNLKAAKLNRNYTALIDNLVSRVLPLIKKDLKTKILPKTESTYRKLCVEIGCFLGHLIDSDLYSSHAQSNPSPTIIHDLVFHFCQYDPQAAGQLLNKHSLNLWNRTNRYISFYLIEYGANVNAVYNDSPYSCLFNALTVNPTEGMIRLLIEHGASYASYREIHGGITYTFMLISALNHNHEALRVLIEKFPEEIAATLANLDTMIGLGNDHEFPYEFGAYKPGTPTGRFYTTVEARLARELILQTLPQNSKQQARAHSSFATSSFSLFTAKPLSEKQTEKNILSRTLQP